MKVAVMVKRVVETGPELRLRPDGWDIDRTSLRHSLNSRDMAALELGRQLCDASGGGEVVAITLGDTDAEDVLRASLAHGADRAVRVWHHELHVADALAVAYAVAPAVAREHPDLVICGARSSDAGFAATGIALAQHLGLPRAVAISDARIDDRALVVTHDPPHGSADPTRLPLPALVTVERRGEAPEPSSDAGATVETVSIEDLGLTIAEVDDATGGWLRKLWLTSELNTPLQSEARVGAPPAKILMIARAVGPEPDARSLSLFEAASRLSGGPAGVTVAAIGPDAHAWEPAFATRDAGAFNATVIVGSPDPEELQAAIRALVEGRWPDAVIAEFSAASIAWAPGLAAELVLGLATDVVEAGFDGETLLARRTLYDGMATVDLEFSEKRCSVLLMRT